jgi:hypothetical protein
VYVVCGSVCHERKYNEVPINSNGGIESISENIKDSFK